MGAVRGAPDARALLHGRHADGALGFTADRCDNGAGGHHHARVVQVRRAHLRRPRHAFRALPGRRADGLANREHPGGDFHRAGTGR